MSDKSEKLWARVQEPELIATNQMGERWGHPAYGQLQISLVSGHSALYDSEFNHHSFISITLHESELCRGLARDWHFAKKEIFKIEMSEAQWATFVSSLNVGSGVPVTIKHANHEYKPQLPIRQTKPVYRAEGMKNCEAAISELRTLETKLAEGVEGLPKKAGEDLLKDVRNSIAMLNSRMPFILESFDEHMENTVEKARIEVNAHVTATIQRAGLESLGVPLLMDKSDDGDNK